MSYSGKVVKRLLAGTLAALMVLTNVPTNVLADEVLGEDSAEESVLLEDEKLEEDSATEEVLAEESSESVEEFSVEVSETEAPNLTKMNLYDIKFRPVDRKIPLIGDDDKYPDSPKYLMDWDWDWDLEHGPEDPGPNPTAYDEDGITYAIGTLKFVSGYEAFSPDNPELWSGYFYPYYVGTEADYLYVKAVNGIRDDNDYQNPEWGDEVSSLFYDDGAKKYYDIISFANAEEAKTKGLVLTAVNGEGDNAKVVATKTVSFERASFEEPTLDVMSARYDADLYGKKSDDLKVGWMSFEDNEILLSDGEYCDNSGYLKYVDDYSQFSETGCNYFLPLYITEADAQENSSIAGSFESVKVFTNKGGEASAENLLEKSNRDGNVVVPIEDDATTLTIKAKTKSSDLRESKIIENTYDISKIQIESYEAKYEVSIEPCDRETEVFGKPVSELQGVVVFYPDSVSGILNYVDSYEAPFPGTDCKHFLAVTIPEAAKDGASEIYEYIKVLSDKGTFEEAVDLVNDPSLNGIAVIPIAHDADELYVKVKPKRGEEFTQTYDLAELKLLSYAEQNEVSVEAAVSGEKYGKSIEELQEDTVCKGYDFSGTLKYVDSFGTAFPGTDCKHFLAVFIATLQSDENYEKYDYIKVYTDKGSVDKAVNLIEEEQRSPIAITEIADDATRCPHCTSELSLEEA